MHFSWLFINSKCLQMFWPSFTKFFYLSPYVVWWKSTSLHLITTLVFHVQPGQSSQSPSHSPLFGPPQIVVPSSMVSTTQASSLPLEGSLVIVVSSLGNFSTHVSFLNLEPHSPIQPTDLHISSTPPLPNSTVSNLIPSINPPYRTHTMTTRSMNQLFKPKQIHSVQTPSSPDHRTNLCEPSHYSTSLAWGYVKWTHYPNETWNMGFSAITFQLCTRGLQVDLSGKKECRWLCQ